MVVKRAPAPLPVSLESRLTQLERKVERLETEAEILRTFYRYCHAIDYGPAEKLDDVFAEDGSFDILTAEGKPRVDFVTKKGRAAIEEYFAWQIETNFIAKVYKHFVFSPLITSLTKSQAKVESYFSAWTNLDGSPHLLCYGRYKDTLVKQPDGRWLIRERKSLLESPPPTARKAGQAGVDRVPAGYRWVHS